MKLIIAALLLIACLNSSLLAEEPLNWPQIYKMIDENFPGVPEKSVPELFKLVQKKVPLFLIDVRKSKEFRVSHIKGAKNFTSAARVQRQIPQKDALIIAYCSVGYRSAAVVTDLRRKGFTNAFNLRGSIFEWVNSGHKVYRGDTETTQVHPYNSKYGVLLKKKYHYNGGWPWW